jgi:hypothetical protein
VLQVRIVQLAIDVQLGHTLQLKDVLLLLLLGFPLLLLLLSYT